MPNDSHLHNIFPLCLSHILYSMKGKDIYLWASSDQTTRASYLRFSIDLNSIFAT